MIPKTLLMKLILVIVLSIGLAGLGVLVQDHRQDRSMLTTFEQERIAAIAGTMALQIDGDGLLALEAQHPSADAFTEWASAPSAARAIHEQLRAVHGLNQLTTDIYTLSIDSVRRADIEAAPDQIHEGAVRFGVTSGERPYWHHSYSYRPEMAVALGGEVSWTGIYADDHGEWVSAYGPIFGSDGAVVALLEVDTPVGLLLLRIERHLQQQIVMLVLTMSAILLITSALVRRLTTSLRQLSEDAERFGEGDYHTPIRAVGGREVEQLSAALERARLAIVEQMASQERAHEALVAALEQAEASTRAKGEFLAVMSHELRTPLNGILGMNSLIRANSLDDDQQEYSEIIHDSGTRLLGMIDDILEYSRSEHVVLKEEAFEPATLVGEVLAEASMSRALVVRYIIADCVPTWLLGDAGRIRQVMHHLLSNAFKFTAEGTVDVRVSCEDERVLLVEIADTGIGISEDAQAQLFEPFTQADTSSTRRFGGAGLGLALSRQLVEQLDGSIGVRSRVGVGSTFWFRVAVQPVDEVLQQAS